MENRPEELGRKISLQFLLELRTNLNEAYTRYGSWWEHMAQIFQEHSLARDSIIRELERGIINTRSEICTGKN